VETEVKGAVSGRWCVDGRKSRISRCHAIRAVLSCLPILTLFFVWTEPFWVPCSCVRLQSLTLGWPWGAEYSWAWLAGDCLAVEALGNCVTGLKSLPDVRAQASSGWKPSGSIHAGGWSSPYRLTPWHILKLISKQTWSHLTLLRWDLGSSPSYSEHRGVSVREHALLQAHLSKGRMSVTWLSSALGLITALGWPHSPLWLIFPALKGARRHWHKWAAQVHAKYTCTGVVTGPSSWLLFAHP